MKRTKMIDREILHSLKAADEAGVWGSPEWRQRFLNNLVIKVGDHQRSFEVGTAGISVFLAYGDTSVQEGVPFSFDGIDVIFGFDVKSKDVSKLIEDDIGYPITRKMKSVHDNIKFLYPKKKIDEYISILKAEWGEEIPVKNSLEGSYELIKQNESENLKEHNRVVFSSLMKSSGLSVKGAASLLGVREDTIKKMLSGKMDINYGIINEMKKLNRGIKYTADKISHEIMKCPKEISPNIIIGEDEEGKKISAAYNCPVSVSIHLEYDGVVKKLSQPGGEWTMDSIRVILGRVIEMTDRKFLMREEK